MTVGRPVADLRLDLTKQLDNVDLYFNYFPTEFVLIVVTGVNCFFFFDEMFLKLMSECVGYRVVVVSNIVFETINKF
jgi:hypothetical protein